MNTFNLDGTRSEGYSPVHSAGNSSCINNSQHIRSWSQISNFKEVSRFQALVSLVPRPFVGLGTRLGFDGKMIAVTCFCIMKLIFT